jgi:hypothetical protein
METSPVKELLLGISSTILCQIRKSTATQRKSLLSCLGGGATLMARESERSLFHPSAIQHFKPCNGSRSTKK